MNVEIEAEAALFPEKEYINGIFVTVSGTASRTSTWKNLENIEKLSTLYNLIDAKEP